MNRDGAGLWHTASDGRAPADAGSRGRLIVVTGQLRRPELFLRSLNEWGELIRDGHCDGVVVSTWRRALTRDSEVWRQLRALDATVIESEQPEVAGVGNIWPQMLAFETALTECRRAALVLKTRSDVWLAPASIRRVLSGEVLSTPVRDIGGQAVFERRVWVPWFIPAVPFFLGDEVFAGTPSDLGRLVNWDAPYDEWADSAPGSAHVRRFLHPFRTCCPIFLDFLGHLWRVEGEPNAFYLAALPRLVEATCYLEALSAYFLVLHRQFAVGAPSDEIEADLWCSPSTANRPGEGGLLGALRAESRSGCRWAIHRDEMWLEGIVGGRLAVPAGLAQALRHYAGTEGPWRSTRPGDEWGEASGVLRRTATENREGTSEKRRTEGRILGEGPRKALRATLRSRGREEPARRLRSRLRKRGLW